MANGILATPVDGDVCQECQAGMSAETLKCSKCKLFSHIRCSGLPTWLIALYASSTRQYICKTCCQPMANFQQKLEEIETLVEAERNQIENIVLGSEERVNEATDNQNNSVYSDASSSSDDDDETSVAANDQVETGRTAESASTDRTNEERMTTIAQHVHENTPQVRNRAQNPGQQQRVCRFYAKKYCRFGTKGEGCKFAHPKKCLKYISHGTKGNRGCRKGAKCDFYHPPLCYGSVDKGECDVENCGYTHLKGTNFIKWSAQNYDEAQNTVEISGENRKSFASVVRQPVHSRLSKPSHESRHSSEEGNRDQNFSEIRREIQQMQQAQTQQMQMMQAKIESLLGTRPQTSQGVGQSCQCCSRH